MRIGRLDIIVELDIVNLGATNDLFLLFGAQLVPLVEVVDVFCTVT